MSQIINPSTGLPFNEAAPVNDVSSGLGAVKVENFPPLSEQELAQLKGMASQSLEAGHHPQTPVACPLQAMCQIVVLVEQLQSRIEDLQRELHSSEWEHGASLGAGDWNTKTGEE
jgi:hypothetical protein